MSKSRLGITEQLSGYQVLVLGTQHIDKWTNSQAGKQLSIQQIWYHQTKIYLGLGQGFFSEARCQIFTHSSLQTVQALVAGPASSIIEHIWKWRHKEATQHPFRMTTIILAHFLEPVLASQITLTLISYIRLSGDASASPSPTSLLTKHRWDGYRQGNSSASRDMIYHDIMTTNNTLVLACFLKPGAKEFSPTKACRRFKQGLVFGVTDQLSGFRCCPTATASIIDIYMEDKKQLSTNRCGIITTHTLVLTHLLKQGGIPNFHQPAWHHRSVIMLSGDGLASSLDG